MRTAAVFEKLIYPGDVISNKITSGYVSYVDKKTYWVIGTPSVCTYDRYIYLEPGTYTLTANVPEGVTCKVYTWRQGTTEGAGQFPANDGEGVLPFTFTVSEMVDVIVAFAYEGWERGTVLDRNDVSDVRLHDTSQQSADPIYETRVLHPEDISDSDSIAWAKNSKMQAAFVVYPDSELWQFCEHTITYVRIFDLDRTEDRMIFKGRVSGVTDRMDADGKLYQELICLSALDFLEDTEQAGAAYSWLPNWLTDFFKDHNDSVTGDGLRRKLIYNLNGDARVNTSGNRVYTTKFDMLNRVLTGGEFLQKWSAGSGYISGEYRMEFRETYSNDICCIEIAETFGVNKSTPIKLGETLKSIQIERGVDSGLYTSVLAVSGVNSDGSQYTYAADNARLATLYGKGRRKVLVNNDIRCTAPMWEWTNPEGTTYWGKTDANRAMEEAVEAYARQEAAKLTEPPLRISAGITDLLSGGMTGYEPFEVLNWYPVVHPELGLYGRYMRITEMKRRLSDGRIESVTLETGDGQQAARNTMSALMARLEEANKKAAEDMQKQLEIVDTKIDDQTGGTKILPLTKTDFDDLPDKDESTLYVVDDNTDVSLWYGDRHINTGGGEGQTIECAAVLSSEQMTEWAPAHELVPVTFRGEAAVYYGQPPARFVVQGNRAVFPTSGSSYTADDIASEITLDLTGGYREKYKVSLNTLGAGYIGLRLSAYDVSGAAETYIGSDGSTIYLPQSFSSRKIGLILRCSSWTLDQSTQRLFPNLQIIAAAAQDGTVYTGSVGLPSGSHFANPIPLSAAEEGFGTAISRRTEPSGASAEEEGEGE